MPLLANYDRIVFYDQCIGNLYSAVKRQCIEVPNYEEKEFALFAKWYYTIFETEIIPLLEGFNHNTEAWYNALTAQQQKLQDAMFDKQESELYKKNYTMFCKVEKQIADDPDKNPKNRCICAPNEEYKHVMGPIIGRLDLIFRSFKGYAIGKDWQAKEAFYTSCLSKGLTLAVEGDGSGFDRTQHQSIKDLVEGTVYLYLLDRGYLDRYSNALYRHHITTPINKIYVIHKERMGRSFLSTDLGHVRIKGTVLSGSMDTTFANTLRMCLYNRYVCEQKLALTPQEYEIQAAGDDFTLFLPPQLSRRSVEQAYNQVFTYKKTGVHGLGQILKFLKFSTIEGVDFCSTETFYCERCASYKIVRKLDRFISLTPWSHAVLSMSKDEQAFYCQQLFEANEYWMKGLDIFKQFNAYLEHQGAKPVIRQGAVKKEKALPSNISHCFYKQKMSAAQEYLTKVDKDLGFTFLDRQSIKNTCCNISWRKHLTKYYNWTEAEIDHICKTIENAKPFGRFECPTLVNGLLFKKNLPDDIYMIE